MKRNKLKGSRPQAPLGAALAIGSTLISGASQIWGQSKQDKMQREELARQQRMFLNNQNAQNLQNTAMSLNNYFGTIKPYDPYVEYKYGGRVRRKLKRGGKLQVTDGGYTLPVGRDTYLVDGNYDHSQVNESGRTGVGMKYGGLTFEVEPGELVKTNKDKAIVLSPKVGPVVKGLNPVEGVMAGYTPEEMFNAQEAKKTAYGINTNGRPTALLGNRFIRPRAQAKRTDRLSPFDNYVPSTQFSEKEAVNPADVYRWSTNYPSMVQQLGRPIEEAPDYKTALQNVDYVQKKFNNKYVINPYIEGNKRIGGSPTDYLLQNVSDATAKRQLLPAKQFNDGVINNALSEDLIVNGNRQPKSSQQVETYFRNPDNSYEKYSPEWFGAYMKPVDWTNFGIQATLPFFSYYTNRSNAKGIRDLYANAERSMFDGYGYTPFGFSGLDTKVDYADAERQRIKEEFYDTAKNVRRNTASSTDYLNSVGELAQQRNLEQAKETDKQRALNQEYRNKDAELRAQTAAQNAATRASYDQAKLQANLELTKQRADFERSNIETNEGLIQALGDSVGNLFQTGMDRLSDYHNMALAYGLIPNEQQKEDFLNENPWFRRILGRSRIPYVNTKLRNASPKTNGYTMPTPGLSYSDILFQMMGKK